MHALVALCALLAQQPAARPAPAVKPAAPSLPPVPDREVVVEAGEFDRQDTLVPLELHTEDSSRRWRLLDANGRQVPFQVDGRGVGRFVLRQLARGAKAKFRLVEDRRATKPPLPRVKADGSKSGVMRMLVDGKPALEFQGRFPLGSKVEPALLRTGYIDPVFTPSGAKVTESLPGDAPRQVGIWSFWKQIKTQNKTVDFWDRVGHSGTIQMESLGNGWEGPVHGGFEARDIYTGIEGFGGATLLREKIRVQVYAGAVGRAGYYLFDVETEQETPKDPVIVPRGTGGGLAVRGRTAWKKAPLWMTSDRNPKETRVLWASLGGQENGKTASIAVFSHPSNWGHPQFLDHSLGDVVVNLSPTKDKDIPIEPYRPFRELYRFVALDGPPDSKLLSRLYNDFAFPPRATLQEAAAKSKP